MKYSQFILVTWISLCFRVATFSQSTLVVLHPTDSTISEAQLLQAAEIIKDRLETFNIKMLSVDLKGDLQRLHLTFDVDIHTSNRSLLTTKKGDLSFRETVDQTVFFASIPDNDPIHQYLKKEKTSEFAASAIMGEVVQKDVDLVKQHLDRLEKNGHLSDLEVAWGLPDLDDKVRLYGLSKHQDLRLGRNDIEEAKLVASSDGTGTDILLEFSEDGSQKWSLMTRAQINKMIAVLLDDVVLMAPKVVEEITMGEVKISGLWSDEGDQVLYAILKTSMLPSSFEFED